MRSLIRAEWWKARQSPLHRFVVACCFAIVAAMFFGPVVMILADPQALGSLGRGLFPVVARRETTVAFLAVACRIVPVLFIAQPIGDEYARETWKMILPRSDSRATFLTAKLIVAGALGVGLFAALIAAALLFGAIGGLITGVDAGVWTFGALWPPLQELLGKGLVGVLCAGLAFGAAVFGRSTTAGILAGLIGPTAVELAFSISSGATLLVVPSFHARNLVAAWQQDPATIAKLTDRVGFAVPWTVSLGLLLAATAVPVVWGYAAFKRRDLLAQ